MLTKEFKDLVHYIIHACSDSPSRLGAVRLNKALWFSDVIAFQDGVPTTGARYVKKPFGPVPVEIDQALDELKHERAIRVEEPKHRYDTRKFFALAPLSESSPLVDSSLVDIADFVLRDVLDMSADEVSDLSHDYVFHFAQLGEEIPLYTSIIAGHAKPSAEDVAWAEKAASRLTAEN